MAQHAADFIPPGGIVIVAARIGVGSSQTGTLCGGQPVHRKQAQCRVHPRIVERARAKVGVVANVLVVVNRGVPAQAGRANQRRRNDPVTGYKAQHRLVSSTAGNGPVARP